MATPPKRRKPETAPVLAVATDEREPFLVALGERVRLLRARRGLTRKGLSEGAGVSERHLANLELGVGNASILVLRQVAQALGSPLAELLGDATTASPEWLLIRDLLAGRDEAELQRARAALAPLFGAAPDAAARERRIALIGLRGAGKSTLGRMLAERLGRPFVELNREIEALAGGSLAEIHNLYGPNAYRRHERRALDLVLERHPDAVIATPGGIVSDPATFARLLSQCFTVWLQASPQEHMDRVVAQGDLRPMAGHAGRRAAMDDLRRILAGRAALYGKADLTIDTGGLDAETACRRLLAALPRSLRPAVSRGAEVRAAFEA
ncbi:MAG TPA: helix-turn-helix transcriptional regulator [Methylibium sp.]|uniref:helix-turn-helix transcriptional regulator n=1 Tax=Methylibium sp. TaxID=2067992 RepID=UPI002DB8E56E|nr:helix-turn-helix transcriptional regulator [Methylibium sp.]HEU4457503.1 helix-turn-helix transcriptional regulator [Methylibium sp.]